MSEEGGPRRGRSGRYVAVGATVLLTVGILTSVADVFRTSRPAVAEGGGTVTVVVRDFNYKPHAIVVKGGRTATLMLSDQSIHAHTFTAPELGIDVTVEPGESRSVTIEIPHEGQYGFYCRFHQAYGMRGFVQFRP